MGLANPVDHRDGVANFFFMAGFEDIRRLVSECRSRIAVDRAALQRIAQELSYTDHVIERATLAYHVSLWTLEKIDQSVSNSRLYGPNPPPRASPPEPSDS